MVGGRIASYAPLLRCIIRLVSRAVSARRQPGGGPAGVVAGDEPDQSGSRAGDSESDLLAEVHVPLRNGLPLL